MIYSVPYVILVIIIGILAMMYEREKTDASSPNEASRTRQKNLMLVGFSIFFLFFGLRGFVFHDWMSYYPEFEDMDLYKLMSFEFGNVKIHEPGWMLFTITCKTVFDSYHFMIFMLTLADVLLLNRFLRRYTDNPLLGLMIFLGFSGISITCNLLRNLPAILIALNALPYLEQRKLLPYIGMCLLAACIHFSALIYIPLYFILNRKLSKWVFLLIILLCNAIFIAKLPIVLTMVKLLHIGGDFVETKLEVYSESLGSRGIGLGFVERLMTAILIFCYFNKLQELKARNRMFINAFVLYLLTFSLLNEFDEIAKRVSNMFIFSYWVLWGELIYCFVKKNNRMMFATFLGLYCIVKVMATVNQPVMEYDNLLFGIKTYQERKFIFDKTFEAAEL